MGKVKRFHPATKATRGNTRAVTHGANSERIVAPLRQQHDEWLRESYPEMDQRIRGMLASRLARIQIAEEFLDRHGVIKNRAGDVYPVADRVEKWSRRAEDLIRAAGVEKKQSSPIEVALAMAALAGAD